jgi:hypothetical protein
MNSARQSFPFASVKKSAVMTAALGRAIKRLNPMSDSASALPHSRMTPQFLAHIAAQTTSARPWSAARSRLRRNVTWVRFLRGYNDHLLFGDAMYARMQMALLQGG